MIKADKGAITAYFGAGFADARIKYAFELAFTPDCPEHAEKPKPDKLDLTKEQKDTLLDLVREKFEEDEK